LLDTVNDQLVPPGGLPWYLRLVRVSRPLLFGDYGGLPRKIF
jgi:hypothetical protein